MHNNNQMKLSELQEIIRTAIKDVVSEAEISPLEKAAKDAELNAINKQIAALNAKKSDLASGRSSVVSENELDELANVAVRYELAPDVNAADFAGKKNRIITAMQATEEPMSKIDVAGELGYNKQNPINADFMELVAAGAIVQSGGQAAPRLNRPAGEPAAAATDDEFDFIQGDMTDAEVDATFAKAAAAGDDEPEIGDIEKADGSAAQMSDEDYEAFMKVSDLENRLASTKSNILKLKKGKSAVGDISDRPSDELQRLRDLKASLEKRIADAVASSKYLQQRQEKTTGKKYEPIDIEDVETEEPLDEWTKGRMQFYAGIKK
jgi:regulator of replication initiation timing